MVTVFWQIVRGSVANRQTAVTLRRNEWQTAEALT
jgi:hypothetical protein